MGWLDQWYPNVIATISQIRGVGPTSGATPTALLSGLDTIAVLGQMSPGVIGAIRSFENQQHTDYSDRVFASEALSSGGRPLFGPALASGTGTSVAEYVAGHGDWPTAWVRSIDKVTATDPGVFGINKALGIPDTHIETRTYEVWILNDEDQLFNYVRQMLNSWQRACDASAAALNSNPDTAAVVASDQLVTFWTCVRTLASDLDVLQENPPVSYGDRLTQATKDALQKTEQFAGEAAAALSEEVGKAAGNVAEGFFGQAGITALLVAGIAVYLFLS